MKYRKLGRTEVKVFELIFGCGRGSDIIINADEKPRGGAVTRALQGGFNWFNTDAVYGQGKSETKLGRILKWIDEKPYVSTKVQLDPTQQITCMARSRKLFTRA